MKTIVFVSSFLLVDRRKSHRKHSLSEGKIILLIKLNRSLEEEGPIHGRRAPIHGRRNFITKQDSIYPRTPPFAYFTNRSPYNKQVINHPYQNRNNEQIIEKQTVVKG